MIVHSTTSFRDCRWYAWTGPTWIWNQQGENNSQGYTLLRDSVLPYRLSLGLTDDNGSGERTMMRSWWSLHVEYIKEEVINYKEVMPVTWQIKRFLSTCYIAFKGVPHNSLIKIRHAYTCSDVCNINVSRVYWNEMLLIWNSKNYFVGQ